jgi:hypothetical protein
MNNPTKALPAIARAIKSADLYGVLQDVQNGITAPGHASMANHAIRLIDKARDELQSLAAQDAAPTKGLPDIGVGVDVTAEGAHVTVAWWEGEVGSIIYSEFHSAPEQPSVPADGETEALLNAALGEAFADDPANAVRAHTAVTPLIRRLTRSAGPQGEVRWERRHKLGNWHEVSRELYEAAQHNPVLTRDYEFRALYTHPATRETGVDAVSVPRRFLEQVYGMAREGCESSMAAYRWCERIDEVFHAGQADDDYAAHEKPLPAALAPPAPEGKV